ncbi:MAG: hypothetical protein K1X29_10070 [Bdellovibrionales bacterium]|nr:hypothetical protein [Bdellovibrionales bacterium]
MLNFFFKYFRHLIFAICLTVPFRFVFGALNDPMIQWRSIKTAHFEIIFSRAQKDLAQNYARAAEKAYQTLLPIFKEAPSSRVAIILVDNTDSPNGSATVVPYPLINVISVLPTPGEWLSHYEDWIYELILHELSHIFTMTPSHGFYTPLRYILGSTVSPNMYLPSWYLEGLAVEVESRYTTHGRLKSPDTFATLRALTEENRWYDEDIGRINEFSIPTYPFSRPYYYGSLLWHSFVEKMGEPFFEEMTQTFSRRVPFMLQAPFEQKTLQDLYIWWDQTKIQVEKEAREQIDFIQKAGHEELNLVLKNNETQSNPAVSPDGNYLVFTSRNPYEGGRLNLIERPATSKESFSKFPSRTLFSMGSTTRVAWAPDSSSFVYDQMSVVGRYQNFRELYQVSMSGERIPKKLTFGLRASQPTFSPSGKEILFVQQKGAGTNLVLLHLKDSKTKTILSSPMGERFSSPAFVSQHQFVFSWRNKSGLDKLYLYDLKAGRVSPILTNFNEANMSLFTRQGLFFISSRNGVNNIYLSNDFNTTNSGTAVAISNTTTSIAEADWDGRSEEIIATRFTGNGSKIYSFPLKKYSLSNVPTLPFLTFSQKNSNSSNSKDRDSKKSDDLLKDFVGKLEDHSYNPISYLWPRYWIPFVYSVKGGIYFEGSTQMSDPTQRHTYSLSGAYDSVTRLGSYGVNYLNTTTAVDLLFTAVKKNSLLIDNDPTPRSDEFYSLSGSFFLPGLSKSWRGELSTHYQSTIVKFEDGDWSQFRFGPSMQLSFDSETKNVTKVPTVTQYFAALKITSYLPGENRLAYQKTKLSLMEKWHGFLPERHYISAYFNGVFAPQLPVNKILSVGDRTLGGNYLVSLIDSPYVLRGYPSGFIVGRSLYNFNLNYMFPLRDTFQGFGTKPFFLRGWEGNLFVDAAAVDGFYYSFKDLVNYRTQANNLFAGSGFELRANTTLFYHLPIAFIFGFYYGFDQNAGGGFIPFIGVGGVN